MNWRGNVNNRVECDVAGRHPGRISQVVQVLAQRAVNFRLNGG